MGAGTTVVVGKGELLVLSVAESFVPQAATPRLRSRDKTRMWRTLLTKHSSQC